MMRSTIAMALIWASAALADFQTTQVAGTPRDVVVYDAGHFVVGSTSGAARFIRNGATGIQDGGTFDAGGITIVSPFDHRGCLGGLNGNGKIVSTCGHDYFVDPLNGNAGRGMRHTRSGTAYGLVSSAGTPSFNFSPGTWLDAGTAWPRIADPGILTGGETSLGASLPVAALSLGPVEYGLMTIEPGVPGEPSVLVAADGGFVRGLALGSSSARSLWLYDNAGVPGALVVRNDGALLVCSNVLDAGCGPIPMPPGVAAFISAAFDVSSGSDDGRGFGFATAQLADGGTAVFQSIADPARPALSWKENGRWIPLAGGLSRVGCVGASFCVAIGGSSSADNVLVYWNAAPPKLDVPSVFQWRDDAPFSVSVDAGDDDGDSVFVTWIPGDAGFPFAFSFADPEHLTAAVSADAGAFCGQDRHQYPYTVRVSDGLHVTSASTVIEVQHIVPPPTLNVGPPIALDAGESISITATPRPSRCATSAAWDAGASRWATADGGVLVVAHPGLLCSAGVFETYGAYTIDGVTKSGYTSIQVEFAQHHIAAPPIIGYSPDATVIPGSGPVRVTATSIEGDAGCAALGYQWSEVRNDGFVWVADGGTLTATPPSRFCGPDAGLLELDVVALGGNANSPAVRAQLTVLPDDAPGPLSVTPRQRTVFPDAGTLRFVAETDGGCGTPRFVWTRTDGGLRYETDAGALFVHVPSLQCGPDVVITTWSVIAQNASATKTQGPAEVLVAVEAVDVQLRPEVQLVYRFRQSEDLQPVRAVIPLAVPDGGCPGAWHVAHDGGLKLNVVAIDAGLLVDLPFACTPDFGTGTYAVWSVGWDASSPPAYFAIEIEEVTANELDAGRAFVVGPRALVGPSRVEGTAQVDGLTCMNRRSDVKVELELARRDGVLESSAVVDAGSTFTLLAKDACARGERVLTARLLGTNKVTSIAMDLIGEPVGAHPSISATLFCVDEGATWAADTRLKALPLPNSCPTQEIAWRVGSVPSGSDVSPGDILMGEDVSFRAVGSASALIGRGVQAVLLLDGGYGNAVELTAERVIEPGTIVELAQDTDTPVANESDAVMIAITLRNTTGCPIEGFELHQDLDGLRYVDGSGRFAGALNDGVDEDGRRIFRDLSLAPHGVAHLHFVARPPLFGRPRPTAVAVMNGVSISGSPRGIGDPNRLPTGCGCGSGGGLAVLAGCLALRLLRRR